MKKARSQGQEALLLTEALRRFREIEIPARNLSPQTRRGYGYDLSEWVATIPPSLPVAGLSTDGIARYLSALDARGLRGATRHRKVAALKTFLRYLEREGALPVDFLALTVEDVTLPVKPSLDPVNGHGLLRVRRKGRRLQELILNYKACRALK